MDEFGSKIISVIVGAVIIFILQALGVPKLVANIFGGMSSTITEEYTNNHSSDQNEVIFWKSTDTCGTKECYHAYLEKYPQGQFIGLAQARLVSNSTSREESQKSIKSEVNLINRSKKTKIYSGIWEGISVNVYIKWANYSSNYGQVDGVVESLKGKIVTTFTGKNYAYRKLKIFLSNGSALYLKADVTGLVKTWTASNIEFSRKYK